MEHKQFQTGQVVEYTVGDNSYLYRIYSLYGILDTDNGNNKQYTYLISPYIQNENNKDVVIVAHESQLKLRPEYYTSNPTPSLPKEANRDDTKNETMSRFLYYLNLCIKLADKVNEQETKVEMMLKQLKITLSVPMPINETEEEYRSELGVMVEELHNNINSLIHTKDILEDTLTIKNNLLYAVKEDKINE